MPHSSLNYAVPSLLRDGELFAALTALLVSNSFNMLDLKEDTYTSAVLIVHLQRFRSSCTDRVFESFSANNHAD